MKSLTRSVIIVLAPFISGCYYERYGIYDKEMRPMEGLSELVNCQNEGVLFPENTSTIDSMKVIICKVEIIPLLDLRDEPNTYHVKLVKCKPIASDNKEMRWIFREELVDHYDYRTSSFVYKFRNEHFNGTYEVGYTVDGNVTVIRSMKLLSVH